MAKMLLWAIVIGAVIGIWLDNGSSGLFPNIVMFSSLGVLAICESIEKVRK